MREAGGPRFEGYRAVETVPALLTRRTSMCAGYSGRVMRSGNGRAAIKSATWNRSARTLAGTGRGVPRVSAGSQINDDVATRL